MRWYYSKILRRVIKLGDWEVAIRKKKNNDEIFLNSSNNEFIPIKNTEKYWFADPILFEKHGKTWLFVEAYNKEQHKGEIGVFEVNSDCSVCNYQTIITMDCHMSYPFVFSYQDNIYMIPESGADKKIYLYKAHEFPYKWEQIGVLCEGKAFRDTTVYTIANDLYMITYERTDNRRLFHTYACHEYRLDIENCKAKLLETYPDEKSLMRPAGLILYTSNGIIRNSQKCNRIYGESLIFWENSVDNYSWKKAKKIKQIDGKQLRIKGKKAILTHTYSCTNDYEVVDYRTL